MNLFGIIVLIYFSAVEIQFARAGFFSKSKHSNKNGKEGEAQVFKTEEGYKSPIGNRQVSVDCGSEGKLDGIFVNGCDLSDTPCDVTANDTPAVFELVFIPSTNVQKLRHKMEVRMAKLGQFKTIYENSLHDSQVRQNERMTVSNTGTIMKKNWKNKHISIRYSIIQEDGDKDVEACAQVDLNMK